VGRLLAAAGIWILVAVPAASAATWRGVPVPQRSNVGIFGVSQKVPGLAWAGGGAVSLLTRDGGLSWSPSAIDQAPVEDATPSRLWQATNDGLQRSDDGGSTWQAVPGLSEALLASFVSFKQLLADPARSGVLFVIAGVGQPGGDAWEVVFSSRDGGATWVRWAVQLQVAERYEWGFRDTWNVLPGRDALLLVRAGGIESDVSQEVAIAGPEGLLPPLQYKTGRRGSGDENNGAIVGLTLSGRAVADSSGRRVLLESTRGWQLSTDGAAHFHVLRPAIPDGGAKPAFDPAHPHRIFAVRGAALVRSDDDGNHWRTLTPGLGGAQELLVGAGGQVYVYGQAGLVGSRDGGQTFAYERTPVVPGIPVTIESLQDDGRGGLLAATERGVWRIDAGEVWHPVEHGLLPLPALRATPLGRTRGVLALRPDVENFARPWVHRGELLDALPARGGSRVLSVPARLAFNRTAFASDADARQIVLGADWTATGGMRWHAAQAQDTTVALASGLVYSTRNDPRIARRSSLWRRSGLRSWKRVARFAGGSCSPRAAGPERVYVLCQDRLLRSDDGGRTLRRLPVPQGGLAALSIAADQRRPDHIAVLYRDDAACGLAGLDVTLTSTDGGTTWLRTDDACGAGRYDRLAIAPDGDLVRWSPLGSALGLQVLDGWR
jgi:hypothetical protein